MASEFLRQMSWVPLIPTPPLSPHSLSLFIHYQIIKFALLSPKTTIFFGNTKLLLISMLKTYLAILMDPKQRLLPLFLILSPNQIRLFYSKSWICCLATTRSTYSQHIDYIPLKVHFITSSWLQYLSHSMGGSWTYVYLPISGSCDANLIPVSYPKRKVTQMWLIIFRECVVLETCLLQLDKLSQILKWAPIFLLA